MSRYKATTIVNFRSGPGTEFDVEGQLAKGEIVQVVDDLTGWLPVMVEDEEGLRSIAWVSAKYLKLAGDDEIEEEIISPIIREPAWLTIAKGQIGVQEVVGNRHNAQVVKYHQTTTLKATNDETPWCSSFVNWCITQAGLKGTNSAAAISWATWGKRVALADAVPGDIVVFSRTGGNHVAFFISKSGASVKVLGGNQSDEVNISTYSTDRLLAVRRSV